MRVGRVVGRCGQWLRSGGPGVRYWGGRPDNGAELELARGFDRMGAAEGGKEGGSGEG